MIRRRRLFLGLLIAASATAAVGSEPVEVELGQSVEGRTVVARVHGDGEATVLILASIHGSEPAGTPLVERFERRLAAEPELLAGKRLVVIPIANPDGYAKRGRFNANGVDLNRNFPAGNRVEHRKHGPTALSEPESVALMRALQRFPPVRVLSIHQPVECIDYDGPAKALAEALGESISNRLPVKRIGSRPGSLGSYVGVTLGVPIITLELPRHAEDDTEKLWQEYGDLLTAFLHGPAME